MSLTTSVGNLVGRWNATKQLWLRPGEAPTTCGSTVEIELSGRGSLVRVRYDWSRDEREQSGTLLVALSNEGAALDGVWFDSWHQDQRFMGLVPLDDAPDGADPALLWLRGSYAAPPGPDWGWIIALRAEHASGAPQIEMHNVLPDGESMRAVLIACTDQA